MTKLERETRNNEIWNHWKLGSKASDLAFAYYLSIVQIYNIIKKEARKNLVKEDITE